MKKLLTVFVFVLVLIGCQRNVSPYQAASRGGMKCGKHKLR